MEQLASLGHDQSDFSGYSWAEMWDDDSGFGPDSYFVHAMAKDD